MWQAFGQLNALVEIALYLCFFVFGPALLVYIVWRFLHDLRRIANALDGATPRESFWGRKRLVRVRPAESSKSEGVANSMFGR